MSHWGNNKYVERDGVLAAQTTRGDEFLLSIEDQPLLSLYTWCKNKRGYFHAKRYGKLVYLHRLVMECDDPEMVVDHVNGIPSDCRRENLRIITQKENMQNRSNTRVKGKYWRKPYEL